MKGKMHIYAKEAMDEQSITMKELDCLPKHLDGGENVLALTSGVIHQKNWLTVLTDKRLLILNRSKIIGKLTVCILELDKHIRSVSCTDGVILVKEDVDGKVTDVQIENVAKETVNRFTNRIQDAIKARKSLQNVSRHTTGQNRNDSYKQLEKLASLKEKNILTEEEYIQEKKKILEQGDNSPVLNDDESLTTENSGVTNGQIECPYCHKYVNLQKKQPTGTDYLIILLGLFFFLLPAAIYALWLGTRKQCPSCMMVVK